MMSSWNHQKIDSFRSHVIGGLQLLDNRFHIWPTSKHVAQFGWVPFGDRGGVRTIKEESEQNRMSCHTWAAIMILGRDQSSHWYCDFRQFRRKLACIGSDETRYFQQQYLTVTNCFTYQPAYPDSFLRVTLPCDVGMHNCTVYFVD